MNEVTRVVELVKYNENSNQIVVSSKDVATSFEKRHDHVMRDINEFKHLPNFGEMFQESSYEDSYSREQRCYLMNRDGFSLLAMGFTGQKALEWKLKYIEAFNALEKEFNSPEKIMARALMIAQKEISTLNVQVGQLEAKVEEQKPKVIFADAVSASHTTILIGELAKLLKQNGYQTGQNRLFESLREKGFLIKRGTSRNLPTQKSMELGLFEVKERTISEPNGSVRITKTPVVTGKGQQYFINLFLGETA